MEHKDRVEVLHVEDEVVDIARDDPGMDEHAGWGT